MIEPELTEAIRRAIQRFPGMKELPFPEASDLLDAVAKRHVADPAQLWWWTAPRGAHETIPYGEKDGLDEIARIVPARSAAFLAVTDDEPRPWPVFEGTTADLLSVLREVRFCECFLGAADLEWFVFDTHHNELVVMGSLVIGATRRRSPS